MSRNSKLRDDPAVKQTLATLQSVYRMGAGIPMLPSALTDTLEKYGCLDGETYAVGLMHMYRAYDLTMYKTDFPKNVYDAWEVISTAGQQKEGSAFVMDSGNPTAIKFALVTFIKDVEDGKLSSLHSWEAVQRLNELADEVVGLQERALREKSWRQLPRELVEGFINISGILADIMVDHDREDKLRASTALLKKGIEIDTKPPLPQDTAIFDPESAHQKLKKNAGKRFKL